MSLEGVVQMSDEFRDFVYSVREYMRDFAELNRLTRGQESSDRQIAWAVVDALDDFNGTPPLTTYSLADLLRYRAGSLLRRMTVITLIESVGLLQTRNHINYSDGGLSVGINDKAPLLMQWLNLFKSTTEQSKLRVKTALNIMSIIGTPGVTSELWSINCSYIGF